MKISPISSVNFIQNKDNLQRKPLYVNYSNTGDILSFSNIAFSAVKTKKSEQNDYIAKLTELLTSDSFIKDKYYNNNCREVLKSADTQEKAKIKLSVLQDGLAQKNKIKNWRSFQNCLFRYAFYSDTQEQGEVARAFISFAYAYNKSHYPSIPMTRQIKSLKEIKTPEQAQARMEMYELSKKHKNKPLLASLFRFHMKHANEPGTAAVLEGFINEVNSIDNLNVIYKMKMKDLGILDKIKIFGINTDSLEKTKNEAEAKVWALKELSSHIGEYGDIDAQGVLSIGEPKDRALTIYIRDFLEAYSDFTDMEKTKSTMQKIENNFQQNLTNKH